MEYEFEILKKKFENIIGVKSNMKLEDLSDEDIFFEIFSKEVTTLQLNIISEFVEIEFINSTLSNIECIDNRIFLTYRYN